MNRLTIFLTILLAIPAMASATGGHPSCKDGTLIKSVESSGTYGGYTFKITKLNNLKWAWETDANVNQIFVKAGSLHFEFPVYSPVVSQRNHISHLDFCVGDPEPEPQCDYSAFGWEETSFGFGFTTDLNAPEGAGCSNPDVFEGRPGDQVRFDVCLDGKATGTGTVIHPTSGLPGPGLPWNYSQIITVGNESEVVKGRQFVRVADLQFENCVVEAAYTWIGSVAANVDDNTCLPTEPCWCEAVPTDPRCTPNKCEAYASIRFNAVPGYVTPEECYAGLKGGDFEAALPDGPITVCWSASGGPSRLSVSARLNYWQNFRNLPAKSYVWLHTPGDLQGYIAATGRDEVNDCSAGDIVNFDIYRELPDICIPFM